MKQENYISLNELCVYYEVEETFIYELSEIGLLELVKLDGGYFIHLKMVSRLERVIRLNQDLDINPQGIDTVMHLLERIEGLKKELFRTKSRLRIYEKGED
jgi:hypothetical protein